MEHKQEKTLKEIKHKINLQKMENEKFNDLTAHISKFFIMKAKHKAR